MTDSQLQALVPYQHLTKLASDFASARDAFVQELRKYDIDFSKRYILTKEEFNMVERKVKAKLLMDIAEAKHV